MLLKKSINKKITFISVFFLFLTTLLITLVQTSSLLKNYTEGLYEQAKTALYYMKYWLEKELAIDPFFYNSNKINNQTEEILKAVSFLDNILILDNENKVILSRDNLSKNIDFSSQQEFNEKLIKQSDEIALFKMNQLNYMVTVFYDSQAKNAGKIVAIYSESLVSERLIEIITGSLAIMLGISLLMVFLLLCLQQVWLTHPLGQIIDVLENVRLKGVKEITDFPPIRSAEFRQLASILFKLIKDLRQQQEKIENYASSLEEKVNERTQELNLINTELSQHIRQLEQAKEEERLLQNQLVQAQKMEVIGNLAAGVAHDLNNILSGLINYPELMLLDLPNNSPFIKPLESIKRSGQRAATIVQDLLILARKGVPVLEPLKLNKIVKKVTESQEINNLLAQNPKILLKLELKEGIPCFRGLPAYVERSVYNLILNAYENIAFEGLIIIKTGEVFFEKAFLGFEKIKEGHYIFLEITDNGIGVTTEHLTHIFEPFYLKRVLKRQQSTGLGLAVVYSTLKEQAGFVNVESTETSGTKITLLWPALNSENNEENGKDEETHNLTACGQKILVVDDLAEQRQLAFEILNKLGYQAICVASGEEALHYLEKYKVELVMLDMIMGKGMDGLETYKQISILNPKQRTIVVTGFAENDRVYELQKLGIKSFIRKPYSIETLEKVIKKELCQI